MFVRILFLALILRVLEIKAQLHFPSKNQFFVGDKCDLGRGENGICVQIQECQSEKSFFQKHGRVRNLCSYDRFTPIVCCEQKIDLNIQRKSEQQCLDYGELVLAPTTTTTKRPLKPGEFQISVVGGELTLPSEFPHMSAIGWSAPTGEIEWRCGGSLISENFVLTAAHCAYFQGENPDTVRISDQNLIQNEDGAQPQQFRIAEVIIHPEYRSSSSYNDIALIRLDGIVNFDRNIRPACLWTQPKINSTSAWITGWGTTEFGGITSNDLLKAELQLVEQDRCQQAYDTSRRLEQGIVDSQLCAGDAAGQRDSCQGDSGGPLQIRSGEFGQFVYHVVGITSFGKACATPDQPGVYTRVSSFIDWIESIVWP